MCLPITIWTILPDRQDLSLNIEWWNPPLMYMSWYHPSLTYISIIFDAISCNPPVATFGFIPKASLSARWTLTFLIVRELTLPCWKQPPPLIIRSIQDTMYLLKPEKIKCTIKAPAQLLIHYNMMSAYMFLVLRSVQALINWLNLFFLDLSKLESFDDSLLLCGCCAMSYSCFFWSFNGLTDILRGWVVGFIREEQGVHFVIEKKHKLPIM